jgi:hypothetical protein
VHRRHRMSVSRRSRAKRTKRTIVDGTRIVPGRVSCVAKKENGTRCGPRDRAKRWRRATTPDRSRSRGRRTHLGVFRESRTEMLERVRRFTPGFGFWRKDKVRFRRSRSTHETLIPISHAATLPWLPPARSAFVKTRGLSRQDRHHLGNRKPQPSCEPNCAVVSFTSREAPNSEQATSKLVIASPNAAPT